MPSVEAARESIISRNAAAWRARLGGFQVMRFAFFSGLCTVVDAATTAWSVSSNLAREINPFVAWRVANPALFFAFEAGWFLTTVAAFRVIGHLHVKYSVRQPFRWNGYAIIVAACCLRLLAGLHNVGVIVRALVEAA
ncbi:MAG: hypothetical protein JTT11_00565 [Candidatus Brockarchaeota archaeon]|nr:hypothetical protein [Candidatus Brockarchaeota archaeon]